jgi:hypothetical protein
MALSMIRRVTDRQRQAKRLAQQNTDFTAEGSPPPGKVSTALPASVVAAKVAPPRRMGSNGPVARRRWPRESTR